jgi:hypothetical protein
MSVIATALKHMLASGMPHEAIVAAIAEMEACGTRVRSSGAERQARYRARLASQSDGSDVTAVTVTGVVSPKKETSPTPPKEKTTPSQSETNVSSKTPRQALETVLDRQRAGDVIEMRQRIRKPLTARGAELLAAQLAKWHDPNEAADAMVLNAWQGFKPEYLENQRSRGSPPKFTKPERPDPFKEYAQELSDAQHRNNRSDQRDWDDAQGLPVLAIDYHG